MPTSAAPISTSHFDSSSCTRAPSVFTSSCAFLTFSMSLPAHGGVCVRRLHLCGSFVRDCLTHVCKGVVLQQTQPAQHRTTQAASYRAAHLAEQRHCDVSSPGWPLPLTSAHGTAALRAAKAACDLRACAHLQGRSAACCLLSGPFSSCVGARESCICGDGVLTIEGLCGSAAELEGRGWQESRTSRASLWRTAGGARNLHECETRRPPDTSSPVPVAHLHHLGVSGAFASPRSPRAEHVAAAADGARVRQTHKQTSNLVSAEPQHCCKPDVTSSEGRLTPILANTQNAGQVNMARCGAPVQRVAVQLVHLPAGSLRLRRRG